MEVITDGDKRQHLYFLLEFLAAWEKQPMCLTPMAYQWCSAFSEVTELGSPSGFQPRCKPQAWNSGSFITNVLFSSVGSGFDPVCVGDTSNYNHERT